MPLRLINNPMNPLHVDVHHERSASVSGSFKECPRHFLSLVGGNSESPPLGDLNLNLHYLKGCFPQRPLSYSPLLFFVERKASTCGPMGTPGSSTKSKKGKVVYCTDGAGLRSAC